MTLARRAKRFTIACTTCGCHHASATCRRRSGAAQRVSLRPRGHQARITSGENHRALINTPTSLMAPSPCRAIIVVLAVGAFLGCGGDGDERRERHASGEAIHAGSRADLDGASRRGRGGNAWLGARAIELTPQLARRARALGKPTFARRGLLVQDLARPGPALQGGLHGPTVRSAGFGYGGDVIQRIRDTPVRTGRDLARAVSIGSPGEVVKLAIIRRGASRKLTVRLGSHP